MKRHPIWRMVGAMLFGMPVVLGGFILCMLPSFLPIGVLVIIAGCMPFTRAFQRFIVLQFLQEQGRKNHITNV